jgi:hypothetical protein
MTKAPLRILLAAAAAVTLAGCDTVGKLNPFSEKETRLEGERRPVFAPGDPYAGPRKLPPPGSDATTPTIPAGAPATVQ